jgi:hypothetical protein
MILVDSLDAVSAAKAAGVVGRFSTDNPLLAEHLLLGEDAINLDAAIGRADEERIGRFAVDWANELDGVLDCAEIADAYGFTRGSIRFAASGTRLLTGQTYRAVALARTLSEFNPGQIRIFSLDREPPDGIPPLVPERFQAPWPRLARFGFFAPITADTTHVDTRLPHVVNDTGSRSIARRLAGLPLSAILGVLSTRPWFAAVLKRMGGPVVILESDNEAIRETLGHLALRGVSVQALKPAGQFAPDRRANAASRELLVGQMLSLPVADHLTVLGEFTPQQVAALTRLIVWHYCGGIELAAQRISVLRQRFSATMREIDRPAAVIANAVVGIDGAHLYSLCRENRIPLIDFEHGVTTGLSRNSESKLGFSEASNCDEMMVCSRASQASFERAGAERTRISVIGLAEQVRRINRHPLQRWLSRRALGIGAVPPVIMHVCTTSLQGNLRGGPYAYTERAVPGLNRRLIQEVYGCLSGWRILFKDYPTQRFPYEPDCSTYAGCPAAVSYVGEEDFRYLRAAADVIVTMVPTSTLGWCVGADVPLVWLDGPATPLLHSAQTQAFRDAFLFIDMRDDDWPKQLADLLSIGLPRLREQWQAKASERKRCVEQYIAGPPELPGKVASTRILDRLGMH